jgi:hypothetical protein
MKTLLSSLIDVSYSYNFFSISIESSLSFYEQIGLCYGEGAALPAADMSLNLCFHSPKSPLLLINLLAVFNRSFSSSILNLNLLKVAWESPSDSLNYRRSSNTNASHYMWRLTWGLVPAWSNSAFSFLISSSFSLSKILTTLKPDSSPDNRPFSPNNVLFLLSNLPFSPCNLPISP